MARAIPDPQGEGNRVASVLRSTEMRRVLAAAAEAKALAPRRGLSFSSEPVGSVGRIELREHDSLDWCGTGWRIEEDLVITNRHVALLFAERQGESFRFAFNRRGREIAPRIDFREEYDRADQAEHALGKILWVAEDSSEAPDLAVLQVKVGDALPPPLELRRKRVKSGQGIGVVGYPAYDGRNDASVMADVFEDIFDVKRFAPGEVVQPLETQWYFTDDASTLGGNSGSAVFDLDTQEVVGLHFGGSFRKANYAVKSSVVAGIVKRRNWVAVGDAPQGSLEEFTEKTRTKAQMAGRRGYGAKFLGARAEAQQGRRTASSTRTLHPRCPS